MCVFIICGFLYKNLLYTCPMTVCVCWKCRCLFLMTKLLLALKFDYFLVSNVLPLLTLKFHTHTQLVTFTPHPLRECFV